MIIFTIQMAANFSFAEKYYLYQKTKLMKDTYSLIEKQLQTKDGEVASVLHDIDLDNSLDIIITDEVFNPVFMNHSMGAPFADPRMIKPDFDFRKYPIEDY